MCSISYTSIICMILVFHYDQPKQKHVLIYEPPRAWAREKACSSKIKLLLIVRVDATHHSTGPTCLPLNLAERPAVYNIFAATSNIYPPQIKIYVAVCIVLMQRPGSPPFRKKNKLKYIFLS